MDLPVDFGHFVGEPVLVHGQRKRCFRNPCKIILSNVGRAATTRSWTAFPSHLLALAEYGGCMIGLRRLLAASLRRRQKAQRLQLEAILTESQIELCFVVCSHL